MTTYNAVAELKNLAFDEESEFVHSRLSEHNKKMEKSIIKTGDRIYTANGFAGSNAVMVVGDDGVIIIDPAETKEAMAPVMEEFRKITDKPVTGLIYTHYHQDHWGGAEVCVSREEYEKGNVKVIAHELFTTYVSQINGELIDIRYGRGIFMFGQMLQRGVDGRTSVGNGPQLMSGTWSLLEPNITFSDTLDIEISGVKIHLFHAPSEAEDEIGVFLVDDDVLHVAEILQGECFPNIYTIRGTNRQATQWIEAVDKLRACNAAAIVGAHIRPLEGKDEVRSLLTDYRDTIQFVHDQTVRLLNEGHSPDYIVDNIKLPDHLHQRDRIGEFYGTVKQTIRRVYDEYIGWWNGEPSKLDPLPILIRAQKYVSALGGRETILEIANNAINDKDYKWAMDILTHLITLDRNDMDARRLKAKAVREQGYLTENATWRNWYMTSANFYEGEYDALKGTEYGMYLDTLVFVNGLKTVPIENMFKIYAPKLNGEKSSSVNMALTFRFTDNNFEIDTEIRNGILDTKLPNKDINLGVVSASKDTFINIMAKTLSVTDAYNNSLLTTDVDINSVSEFFSYFDGYTSFMDLNLLFE